MEFLNLPKLFAANLYAIPDYQRDYEWTSTQNGVLLDDVFALFESDEDSHFFGAIVTIPYEGSNGCDKSIDFDDYGIKDGKGIKHVVDGQQRLTSFTILAKVIADLAKESYAENPNPDTLLGLVRRLDPMYSSYSHVSKDSTPAPVLILNGNTGRYYNNKIMGLTKQNYSKLFKGAKRLNAAYTYFKKEIDAKYKELYKDDLTKRQKFYSDLTDVLTTKVTIVEISCDASSNAFQVFDSLNGKGLDLTAADRIKNILMSKAPMNKRNEVWTNLVQKVGEDFLAGFFVSYFFYCREGRVSKNKLPDEFKKECDSNEFKKFEEFICQLYEKGEIYGALRKAKTKSEKLNCVLKSINKLNMEQVYVMLYAAVSKYGVNVVDGKDFLDYSEMLIRLVVRMQVCEKSMNKLDSCFSEWIKEMKNSEIVLKNITKKIAHDIKQIVPDEDFERGFAQFAPKSNQVSEYYLIKIENYLNKTVKESRTTIDAMPNLSVEHVIPQTCSLSTWYGDEELPPEVKESFFESVVENIGNKAMICGDDNSAAQNFEYKTKLNVYLNGKKGQQEGIPYKTFCLIKEIVDDYPEKFTHEQVFDRAKKLAKIAVQIW